MSRSGNRGHRPTRLPAPEANRRPLLVAVLTLLGCAGLWFTVLAGTFKVRHIDVVGANVPSDAIVQASDAIGQNIFTVRSDDLIVRLAAVREIQVQRVDTTFPNRLTVYATIRQAVLAWQTNGGLYEVDANGQIVRQVKSSALPAVVATEPAQLDAATVAAVRYAAGALPRVPHGGVSRFQLSASSGLSIVGRTGWTAVVGTGPAQRLVTRIATLVGFLVQSQNHAGHLVYVNLKYPTSYARFGG